jgi:hypothetical protein
MAAVVVKFGLILAKRTIENERDAESIPFIFSYMRCVAGWQSQ